MAAEGHDYHRGEMDIREQANTFHAFGALTKWLSLATAVLLLTLTLWFATDAGFFGGLITGGLMLAIGIWVLRERKPKH